jgi:glutamate synthase domain-containing protein 2/glutamate synthase domain-containing protein 1/glutamate synthase domain-containing protein 3
LAKLTANDNSMTKEGLYSSEFEKDACGIGFIASIDNIATNETLQKGLLMLKNMEHRGGVAADGETGDGAGITVQLPFDFYKDEARKEAISLNRRTNYGIGMIFLPKEKELAATCMTIIYGVLNTFGFEVVWKRQVPVNSKCLGKLALENEPDVIQLFVKIKTLKQDEVERKLFVMRKSIESKVAKLASSDDFYIASFSTRTVIYKGELRTWQLEEYYLDLQQHRFKTAFAIVHSRYSTNTFPEWRLAQPFRFIAHNGEINTIKGNVNKMLSRESLLEIAGFSKYEIDALLPICNMGFSDSANLDFVVELLVRGGRSIEQVMAMLVPSAWIESDLSDEIKAFYQFHSTLMEPWDGPAAICFTDGKKLGACIDRNGLRPTRYCVTKDNHIIFASETGVLPLAPDEVVYRNKLEPGKMILVDFDQKRIIRDAEIKPRLAKIKPYQEWIDRHLIKGTDFFEANVDRWVPWDKADLIKSQLTFGYSKEDLKFILNPLAHKSAEPVGAMGNDTPLAVFAKRNAHISNYFKQIFAQVSNPAIDPIREKSVMSLGVYLGTQQNLLAEKEGHARKIFLTQPVIKPSELSQLKSIRSYGFKSEMIRTVYMADFENLKSAIQRICNDAESLVYQGVNLLILSNNITYNHFISIPSLLITGAIHHHLLSKGLRAKVSIIVEAGDALETQHFATLIGYGAVAICPYLAFSSILAANPEADSLESQNQLIEGYIQGIGYGLRKILSKMGISTLQSYESAQIFEILGLDQEVTDVCFKGTSNRISGKGFDLLEKEILANHAFALDPHASKTLPDGGLYQWRVEGEKHLFNPKTIHLLQKSTKLNDFELFKEYTSEINDQSESNVTLRSLFDFQPCKSIPLEQVEPIEAIMKRFSTGAMSFGSISEEAHTTIAKAMNQIGGKSNSGEGGEDAKRFEKDKDGFLARSAIKQVASGRFGVTAHYLMNADEIQIKVAQGAKPGEGGQLPGQKVDENIARIRHSTPGVTLISPPPHHDIYSIEDLAQLIYDLKNTNPAADINVKLVAEAGVGTIAAGVAKANADAILISGHDGGTGASPISSIHHAGIPWEIGLAEAHQTLLKNNLRNRVRLQTDGQIRTARDLAIATMLGAEEWGVATAVLVVEGCIMMRKCHLNTCPVGVATQNPALRKMFTGKVEDIVNFFRFMAMELREIMAELGVPTVNQLVGRTDLLKFDRSRANERAGSIDLTPLLYNKHIGNGKLQCNTEKQEHKLESVLDQSLIEMARPALEYNERVKLGLPISTRNRATGAMLSGKLVSKHGPNGLADDAITIEFNGTAGQSFGAFLAKGITFSLQGEANDYVGKGLSGGKISVFPNRISNLKANESVQIGNVALYGATSGKLFVNGRAGERFAVRNSGAQVVIEGLGDHGCEYMTGGKVIVLGNVGKNFAAGMSGGVAYVFVENYDLPNQCNMEMVELDECDSADFNYLKSMIEEHITNTSSTKAIEVMSNWEEVKGRFVKVIPTEYRKVIESRKAEKVNA